MWRNVSSEREEQVFAWVPMRNGACTRRREVKRSKGDARRGEARSGDDVIGTRLGQDDSVREGSGWREELREYQTWFAGLSEYQVQQENGPEGIQMNQRGLTSTGGDGSTECDRNRLSGKKNSVCTDITCPHGFRAAAGGTWVCHTRLRIAEEESRSRPDSYLIGASFWASNIQNRTRVDPEQSHFPPSKIDFRRWRRREHLKMSVSNSRLHKNDSHEPGGPSAACRHNLEKFQLRAALKYPICGQGLEVFQLKYPIFGQGKRKISASNIQFSGQALAGASRGLAVCRHLHSAAQSDPSHIKCFFKLWVEKTHEKKKRGRRGKKTVAKLGPADFFHAEVKREHKPDYNHSWMSWQRGGNTS
ncbi:hypothetical protein B0H16DRAFT_1466174 [Mycena metata]|uniref:Uncharacterized protein n=1 Tax=Mycena metata TaxID=1033252 RepID=A0AAD7IAC3_9AGAR|nr:hypothetical protein B0H16DRAFT_1466174 [Mycena metata]